MKQAVNRQTAYEKSKKFLDYEGVCKPNSQLPFTFFETQGESLRGMRRAKSRPWKGHLLSLLRSFEISSFSPDKLRGSTTASLQGIFCSLIVNRFSMRPCVVCILNTVKETTSNEESEDHGHLSVITLAPLQKPGIRIAPHHNLLQFWIIGWFCVLSVHAQTVGCV